MRKNKKKQLNPKIEQLIQKAEELFFRFGIRRVSIEEICREASISKMTFYRYFKNKAALVTHIVDKIYQEQWDNFHSIRRLDISFEEKIQKIMFMKMKFAERFSREFIKDLIEGTIPELKGYMAHENERFLKTTRQMFIEAQRSGDIRPDIKIDFIMYMLMKMREIFRDDNLQQLYPDAASFMKEAFNFFYYGVLKRKK